MIITLQISKRKLRSLTISLLRQCTIVNNTIKLPTDSLKRTNDCISTISFTKDDIEKMIKNLHPIKALGHDMISICMLKICSESILKHLELIFKSYIKSGKFPIEWKKATVFPVYKKNDKQRNENYRPILLLPICGKIPERPIYNKMFEFFIDK